MLRFPSALALSSLRHCCLRAFQVFLPFVLPLEIPSFVSSLPISVPLVPQPCCQFCVPSFRSHSLSFLLPRLLSLTLLHSLSFLLTRSLSPALLRSLSLPLCYAPNQHLCQPRRFPFRAFNSIPISRNFIRRFCFPVRLHFPYSPRFLVSCAFAHSTLPSFLRPVLFAFNTSSHLCPTCFLLSLSPGCRLGLPLPCAFS